MTGDGGTSTTRPRPAAAGEQVLSLWRRCEKLPFGRALFSRMLGRSVPYTASIGAVVQSLEPGHVRVSLKDRRAVRNHLGSVHAVALTNLGEMASGLAMTSALPAGVRGIVLRLETEFLKKARGMLLAESRVDVPDVHGDMDFLVTAEIRDTAEDVVAVVRVNWRLGLARQG